jgi:hypothetical protein
MLPRVAPLIRRFAAPSPRERGEGPPPPNAAFIRWSGLSLAAGGVLTILINACLTPLMPMHRPFAETASSAMFLYRQSASAVAVALLLFGSIGLCLIHDDRFSRVAFAMAFLGSALVLAWEWVDIFIIRDLAMRAPSALEILEKAPITSPYNLGALIPISLFTLGWIAFSIVVLRAKQLPRHAAALVIAGFFALPLLTAAFGPKWGGALGNAILGSGFVLLGRAVRARAAA